jgi:hypothetical protein
MKNPPEEEARQRSRRARQVISGSDVRPPAYSPRSVSYEEEGLISGPQWIYFGILAALLALGTILYLVFGGGVASVIFFLLAIALFAGWLVF